MGSVGVSKFSTEAPQVQHQSIISALLVSIGHEYPDNAKLVVFHKAPCVNQCYVIFRLTHAAFSIYLSLPLLEGTRGDAQVDMLNAPGNFAGRAILCVIPEIVGKVFTHGLLITAEVIKQYIHQLWMADLKRLEKKVVGGVMKADVY